MMEWGFDKEFIAKDCGINLASLETRLRRANERERRNGNQRTLVACGMSMRQNLGNFLHCLQNGQ